MVFVDHWQLFMYDFIVKLDCFIFLQEGGWMFEEGAYC